MKKISFIINTAKNELDHLKLLLESLEIWIGKTMKL